MMVFVNEAEEYARESSRLKTAAGGLPREFLEKFVLCLSPFAPQSGGGERQCHGKARFEWLNLAARSLGDLAAGISRAQLAEMTAGALPGRLQRQGGEM